MRNFLLFCSLFVVTPVLANSGGPPANRTGELGTAPGNTCLGCHSAGANPGPTPTVTVEGLPATATAGSSVVFTIRVHSNDGAGGTGATCSARRCAGFAASTTTAGTFAVVAGQGTRIAGVRPNDNETTHSARKPFDASGDATFAVQLNDLQPGVHTLYVAGNDVNGSSSGGDRVGLGSFSFSVVADGDGDGILDADDSCPADVNTGTDADSDGFDDACDACDGVADARVDTDRDGVDDACDNCRVVTNTDQRDVDGDLVGDACDLCDLVVDDQADADADAVGDACDNCLNVVNVDQRNFDGDALGDSCDDDDDNDGLSDVAEAAAGTDPNNVDTDGDGTNDDADTSPLGDCTDATALGDPCSAGRGACEVIGALVCGPDTITLVCDAVAGAPIAVDDATDNNIDDDCDGQLDEDVISVLPGEEGEGEGEVGEGEGEVGEGEGEVGEGEGEFAEGEGEVAEGEGEVAEGEGEVAEGEGDVDEGEGCPCSGGRAPSSSLALFTVALVLLRRRR